jgi:hypothetical protein
MNEDAEETSNLTTRSDEKESVTMGRDALQDEDEVDIVMGTEADVTEEDIALLGSPDQDLDGGEDELVATAGLDDTDFDGEPLNEGIADITSTGEELDIPGDTPNNPRADSMGQGDEENDYYSLGSDKNDEITEGTP